MKTLLEATGDLDTAEALQNSLPSWLLNAPSKTLAALDKTARALQASRTKVEADLGKLRPLKTFCSNALNEALVKQWEDVGFDVELDRLELPGADCGCAPEAKTSSDQTLLTITQAVDTTTQVGTAAVQAGIASTETAVDPATKISAPKAAATPQINHPVGHPVDAGRGDAKLHRR
ncbi:hypothetical protein ACQ4OE_12175 [Pseudomonas sp. WC2]